MKEAPKVTRMKIVSGLIRTVCKGTIFFLHHSTEEKYASSHGRWAKLTKVANVTAEPRET